jgi:acyl-CoA thioester hydrolase
MADEHPHAQAAAPIHLSEFPVIVGTPIAWGDMDYFRHVNNIVFFRYFESARIEYLERIGFREEMQERAVGPILASTHARFRHPLTYPDWVWVGARTIELNDDRFVMEYRIESSRSRTVAAEGGGVVVSYSYEQQRKAPLPEAVRRAIEALERQTGAGAADTATL